MEKIKKIFHSFCKHQAKLSREVELDKSESLEGHVLTVEEFEGRGESTKLPSIKCEKRSCKFGLIVDFFFCGFVTLLWMSAYLIFARFTLVYAQSQVPEKSRSAQELFYSGYVVMLAVVCITGFYLETLVLRSFERFSPKLAVVVKKSQGKGLYTLRMRVAGNADKEFVEAEIEEKNLAYATLLDVCCKEMELEKDQVLRLKKMPETKIRNDDDVKRFRKLEYIEIIVK